ncbi:MAG: serine/threonine protein kinase [Nannocystaceae bacterium]|nr:protein kinase [bacterium]
MQAEDVTKVIDREPEAPVEDVPPEERAVAEAKPAEVETGRILRGRYELIHRLGHGGMASVYLGRAIGTAGFERLVAVKVIHPHLVNEAEFVEMFLDEARIAAKIHHPNVCETIDLGDDDGVFFMVMEYVEGETLSSLVRQLRKRDQKLPIAVALQIAADACRGLEAAHSLKDHDGTALDLVHRDVSPHNLLVTMDGRVKVVDFGIMKAAGKRSNTLTGQLRGKLTYMSPEQARGEPVDRRSDIYAMGVILWELLAGARFYRGETDSEILAQVGLGRRQDISEFRDDIPESVTKVLDSALAQSRHDRYESADEMLKGLRAALRQLLDADEDDPREVLGDVMERFFGSRIQYIQAAIRGQVDDREGSSTRGNVRAANDQTSVVAARGLTPSQVEVGRTGTLTASPAAAPARTWALWLILPLAGAALGTLAVRAGFDREAEPKPVAAQAQPKPAEVKPDLVKWFFNTDPQGATVVIDGKALESTTPTSVQLPRSDETVVVKISLAGYKTREVEMAPLSPENHNVRLEPEYKTTFSARTVEPKPAEETAPAKVRTRPRKRTRPKKKPDEVPQPPVASPPPQGDARKPEDVPDFLKKNKKKTP